jgi:hypothetical protein
MTETNIAKLVRGVVCPVCGSVVMTNGVMRWCSSAGYDSFNHYAVPCRIGREVSKPRRWRQPSRPSIKKLFEVGL